MIINTLSTGLENQEEMGSSIFGTPITVATLRAMPEYQGSNSISQKDRAKVALEKMNAEGKAMDARNFLEKLQTRFAESDNVSTMCMIYNATGETMTFVIARDWKGRVCESAYPMIVANGQWGVFLHGQYYNQDKNSRAGIVYSALNNQGNEKHWFMGFSNSTQGSYNQVLIVFLNLIYICKKIHIVKPVYYLCSAPRNLKCHYQ